MGTVCVPPAGSTEAWKVSFVWWGQLRTPDGNARYDGEPAQPGDQLRVAVTGLPGDADSGLVGVQLADMQIPAEWVRSVAPGITQIGITLPIGTAVGDSVPLVVQRHMPDGRVITSQTVSISIEPARQ